MPRVRADAGPGSSGRSAEKIKASNATGLTGVMTRVKVNRLQRQQPLEKVKKVVVNMHKKDGDGGMFRKRRVLEGVGNMKVVQEADIKRLRDSGSKPGSGLKRAQLVEKCQPEKKTIKVHLKRYCPEIPVPVPLQTQSPESLNLDNLTVAIDDVIRKLPEGVTDIDKDDICAYGNPQYVADIIDYVHLQEERYHLDANFLTKQDDIDANMRAILIDWLIQVQTHLCISPETLHMCVAMVDRFLALQKIQLAKLQLLGITCLLVASKFEDRYPPAISKLIHLTDDTYTFNDVIRMERLVLVVLRFQINIPTPMIFLDRYWKAMGSVTPKVLNVAVYLLDLTLPDLNMVKFRPSARAAACLCLAAKIILPAEECRSDAAQTAWTPSLRYYTSGLTPKQLWPCMHRMCRALLKAEKSKFQGAYEKYSSQSMYSGISHWPVLTTSEVVRELSANELPPKSG